MKNSIQYSSGEGRKGGTRERGIVWLRSPSWLLAYYTRTTCIVGVPLDLVCEHCSTVRTVPLPEEMFLLDMPRQPVPTKCRGIRAALPLAQEAERLISDTTYPVRLPQVNRKINSLDSSTTPHAVFHPATFVGAELWRAGNRDQPLGVLVCEIVVESVVTSVAVCSVPRHCEGQAAAENNLNHESYRCSAAQYDLFDIYMDPNPNLRPR
ncbi:hypothetical protein HD554DRAFT_2070001 [Boletus coccyginus]|nr:hypothetical protein HD554DRAFT_2070001 [Boletus coccyginus]